MTRVLAGVVLALATAGATGQVDVPPVARMTDLTGTLAAGEREALEQKLAAFEQRKGSQIAVLLVPSTQPETIEQYAIRVADGWKLGRKGVDDGAILLVAKDDRAVRIEVGYGLEGAVPDAIAKRIVEEDILPRFRAGDFAGGIAAGVDRLIGVIDGEPLPEPTDSQTSVPSSDALIPLGFLVLMFGGMLKRLLGVLPGALLAGGLVGAGAWLLVGTVATAMIAAVVAFLLTLALQPAGGRGLGGGRYGGWGGGFRGGSLGGGGFRGGGGGFGGGGASGRW